MFDFLFGALPLPIRVVMALFDYLIKAASEWRETPEGATEWQEFATLYEQMLNDEGANGVEFGVEDRVTEQTPDDSQRSKRPRSPQARVQSLDARDNAGDYGNAQRGKS